MVESFINVTEGAGKKAHTNQRTIGANVVEDEYTLPGEYAYATYTFSASAVSHATAASHMLQIMAGASLNVRIRKIVVSQRGVPAAVISTEFVFVRLTTAGTGGTVITARPYDGADAAAGATGMTLPTAKGTEGVTLWDESIWLGTVAVPVATNKLVWTQTPGTKPIIIPAGTTNGLAIKNSAGSTATMDITVEVVETNFV